MMRFVPGNWMDNLNDEILKDPFFRKNSVPTVMKTDIRESDEGYLLDIELPGIKKEDIKMELEDGTLTISAARNVSDEEKESQGKLVRQERVGGSCTRSYYIGEDLRAEEIRARHDNGELKVFIPKKDPKAIQRRKTISID